MVGFQLLADDAAKAVGANARQELLFGAAAGQGDRNVCVRTTHDRVVGTGLVPVLNQVDKGLTNNENHGFIVA